MVFNAKALHINWTKSTVITNDVYRNVYQGVYAYVSHVQHFTVHENSLQNYSLKHNVNLLFDTIWIHYPVQTVFGLGIFCIIRHCSVFPEKQQQPSHSHFILITWAISTLYCAFLLKTPFFSLSRDRGSAQETGNARTTNESKASINVLHHHIMTVKMLVQWVSFESFAKYYSIKYLFFRNYEQNVHRT